VVGGERPVRNGWVRRAAISCELSGTYFSASESKPLVAAVASRDALYVLLSEEIIVDYEVDHDVISDIASRGYGDKRCRRSVTSRWRGILALLLVAGVLFGFSAGAPFVAAQGVLMDESGERFTLPRHRIGGMSGRGVPPAPPISYAIKELSVDTSINNQVAVTQVRQVFLNTGSRPMEARFVFPLPYEGAIDQMTFLVDGKEYEAKLLKADEARRIYQGYVQRNQDPALLQWMGTGMFQTSVFPIPPGASRTVTLRYSQLLRRDGTLTDYWFPLSTAQYTSTPIDKLAFRVALADPAEIKNVYSPTHAVDIKRDDAKHVVVSSQLSNVVPGQDFRLVYDTAAGPLAATLLSAWPEGEDQGYFVLLASPALDLAAAPVQQKTVLFVVDQSGSMSGAKIEQARSAAKFVLQNLRPDDMFNLISYHGSVNSLSPEMLRFNEESRSQALGFINGIQAGGMTNIDDALQQALSQIKDTTLPSYVVFLTDGVPTVGEQNEMKIAANCRLANTARARILSFGVGFDVNSRLLDRISRDNRGQTEYVLPNEDLEAAVARLYAKIAAPVMTQMAIEYQMAGLKAEDGPLTSRLYPQEHTELYAGSQLVLVGRYRQSGPASIKINGRLGDQSPTFEFPVEFAQRGEVQRYPFVSKLWAMRRIGELIDQIDLDGKHEELVNELVQLSLQHGIVTPYTAYLADENSAPQQLADVQGQRRMVGNNLLSLAEVEGANAFSGRSFKQQNKMADNLQGLEARNSGGFGGMAGRSGRSGAPGGGGGLNPSLPAGPGQQAAGTPPAGEQGIRQVGPWTLYKRGALLIADNAVDVDLEAHKDQVITLKRFSDEWFALAAANTAADNLVLSQQGDGEELVVRLRGQVYRIL
jgi:Ca-activated chloride channel homolog